MPQLVADLNWRRDTKLASLTAALPMRDEQPCTVSCGIPDQNWLHDRVICLSVPPSIKVYTYSVASWRTCFTIHIYDWVFL